jgi:hypothetical protein
MSRSYRDAAKVLAAIDPQGTVRKEQVGAVIRREEAAGPVDGDCAVEDQPEAGGRARYLPLRQIEPEADRRVRHLRPECRVVPCEMILKIIVRRDDLQAVAAEIV